MHNVHISSSTHAHTSIISLVFSHVELSKEYLMGSGCNSSQLADLFEEILVIVTATEVLQMLHAYLNTAVMQSR